MTGARTASGLAGFVLLGLSPSYVDWQQSPERRGRMVLFYLAASALIWYGVLRP